MKASIKLGILTLVFFGVGGFLLIEYGQDKSFIHVMKQGLPIASQLLVGLTTGLTASAIAVWIISRSFFDAELAYYNELINQLGLNYSEIIFLSLCAGIGEELFFRGGIQPFLGIWWTSILFVALHGYLNPRNWRISFYGLVMVGIIAGFGYLFRYIGIFSAMAAHTVLDVVLFVYMSRNKASDR